MCSINTKATRNGVLQSTCLNVALVTSVLTHFVEYDSCCTTLQSLVAQVCRPLLMQENVC